MLRDVVQKGVAIVKRIFRHELRDVVEAELVVAE
jgi:hypothetical protein